MARPYYLMSDTDLLSWATTASEHLTANFAAFQITPQQADDFASRVTAFRIALAAWRDNATRTPIASTNKQAARVALFDGAKYIVATVNSNPATTDAQRDELGIKARKRPTPRPKPSTSPMVDVERVDGRTVTYKMHTSGRRGRPADVQGASVFTFVGPEAPADPAAWTFEGLMTRTTFSVSFENRTEADTAWVSAFWYNERGQAGSASAPVSVNLPASSVVPVGGAAMKIAA